MNAVAAAMALQRFAVGSITLRSAATSAEQRSSIRCNKTRDNDPNRQDEASHLDKIRNQSV